MEEKKSNLARGGFWGGQVQAAAFLATQVVDESIGLHDLSPLAAAALGRALMGAAFLALNLKGEDSVTLRIKGQGPLGGVLAQADAGGTLRGYVGNPRVDLPLNEAGKLDVGGAVGREGYLYVTKDLGLKEPYTGASELVSGEIAEDLANYFYKSEQTPAALSLGVLIDVDQSCKAAGGFIIKALPGADREKLARLEEWLAALPPVSSLACQLNDPEEMLRALFPQEEPENLTLESWRLACRCSRRRLEKAIISLGREELEDMIQKDGKAELRCQFCNKTYNFTKEELKTLLQEAAG